MNNVSDIICRENQNTHLMFHNVLTKIVLFMRRCGKILCSRTGHRWQHGTWALHSGYL